MSALFSTKVLHSPKRFGTLTSSAALHRSELAGPRLWAGRAVHGVMFHCACICRTFAVFQEN